MLSLRANRQSTIRALQSLLPRVRDTSLVLLTRSIRSYSSHPGTSRTMTTIDAVLAGKYPAKAHAKKVVEYLQKHKPDVSGIIYLEGQKTRMIEDNDEPVPFR